MAQHRMEERLGRSRGILTRALPFISPWILSLGLLPTLGYIAHNKGGSDPTKTPFLVLGMAIATATLALLAYELGHKRRILVRWHMVATIVAAGTSIIITTIIGYPEGWSWVVILSGIMIALSWNLPYINSLRSDTSTEEKTDTLADILNMSKTKFGKMKQEGSRTEVPLKHGPGETINDAQAAVSKIESFAGAPRGLSRVVGDPDDASKSTLIINHEDTLRHGINWNGPVGIGLSIADPISGVATYSDNEPVQEYLAGGVGINPTNYGVMGVSRAGKTVYEQMRKVTQMGRKDVVLWWSDKVKGAQTAEPIKAGLDVMCLSDKIGDHKMMLNAVEKILIARVNALGKQGFRAWTPDASQHPDLQMPFLIVHMEEADALLADAGPKCVFLASKCLSAGISMGFSLQRADHLSMPTGLRFNVSSWSCFGTGDDISAGFALSDYVLNAGAHPEYWKANKPGYFYHEGPGVDEERYSVPARTHTTNDEQLNYYAEVLAPSMAKLDDTSVTAAGEWYGKMKNQTRQYYGPVSTSQEEPDPIDFLHEDIQELKDEGLIPPQPDGDEASETNPSIPLEDVDEGRINFSEIKPWAATPEEAAEAFDGALRRLSTDSELRDPEDNSSAIFSVSTLVNRYKFRSRPWFSERLSDMADGEIEAPNGLQLTRAEDVGPGHYRLTNLLIHVSADRVSDHPLPIEADTKTGSDTHSDTTSDTTDSVSDTTIYPPDTHLTP